MPELKLFSVTAREIKIGDKIVHHGVVEAHISRTKWTEMKFSNELLRVLNTEEFEVQREVPTESEKAAKDLQRTLLMLDHKEASARAALAHARTKMQEDMAAGETASYWHWMDVPEAEAQVELWDAVKHVHEVHALRAWCDPEAGVKALSRVEAIRLVRDERRKQALSYYRALSRSTSVVSNLFEDIKLEALSAWARDLEWIILEEA